MNITKPDGKTWFLTSCIELYKDKKGLTGEEAFNYLRETGALGFIINCWEGLHTTGPEFIIESIDEFIKNNSTV
jgi:hypothetical protein